MDCRIVVRGEEPSGRILALLCARTGETIDRVRGSLRSSQGLLLKDGLSGKNAQEIITALPSDGSVEFIVQREVDSWVAVLMGYRPGSRGRLRVSLQKMSRLSTEEVIHFLANTPVVLKAGISRKTAETIKQVLEHQGGIVEIRPHTGVSAAEQKTEKPDPPEKTDEETHLEVLSQPPGMAPDIPPPAAETARAQKPVMNVVPPPEFIVEPPDRDAVSSPPIPGDSIVKPESCPVPFSFRFTVPASPLPPLISGSGTSGPPDVISDATVVPIYLHPVAENQMDMVCGVLSENLGIETVRCRQLVEKAPVAVWACRERLNALVTLRGLSEKGVPVSLIPGRKDTAGTAPERSFFGWMNGSR